MTTDTEPPSDPEAPVFGDDDTRKIVIRLERQHQRAQGAATVWRAAGGIAATVALALATWGVVFAQQAAVDHERVNRLEETAEDERTAREALREDLAALSSTIAALTAVVERLEEHLED